MKIIIRFKGGSGSGNFQHAGRKGKVGGSATAAYATASGEEYRLAKYGNKDSKVYIVKNGGNLPTEIVDKLAADEYVEFSAIYNFKHNTWEIANDSDLQHEAIRQGHYPGIEHDVAGLLSNSTGGKSKYELMIYDNTKGEALDNIREKYGKNYINVLNSIRTNRRIAYNTKINNVKFYYVEADPIF